MFMFMFCALSALLRVDMCLVAIIIIIIIITSENIDRCTGWQGRNP